VLLSLALFLPCLQACMRILLGLCDREFNGLLCSRRSRIVSCEHAGPFKP
jgi:hypothetical protein